MQVLIYNELNSKGITGLSKLIGYLESDDFHSADVKKVGDNLYRSRSMSDMKPIQKRRECQD